MDVFSKKALSQLIIPLIIEQILAVTVGMADVIMVARVGESAVSGISLADNLNILIINIFSAVATGGAVVSAQYLGSKDREGACKAANQLLLSTTVIALIVMFLSLVGNQFILSAIYPNTEAAVMNNTRIYFLITALSFPFLAVYNSCAALFRSMGNSKVSMLTSLCMNLINIGGNAILIFVFHLGAAGAALASLISRAIAAVIVCTLLKNQKYIIHIDPKLHLGFHPKMIRRILGIGIPNGLENSMFQIGKILVMGLIISFGSNALAANAVAVTVAGLEIIPGSAMGLALITVVGQCVGAGELEQAKKYTKKLLKKAYLYMGILNVSVIFLLTPILSLYQLSPDTERIAAELLIYHSICCVLIWPAAFSLPNALRAASDVKFTMITSIFSMWMFRIGFSYLLGKYMGLGVMGVWMAMTIDWLFRGTAFAIRFKRGRWLQIYH